MRKRLSYIVALSNRYTPVYFFLRNSSIPSRYGSLRKFPLDWMRRLHRRFWGSFPGTTDWSLAVVQFLAIFFFWLKFYRLVCFMSSPQATFYPRTRITSKHNHNTRMPFAFAAAEVTQTQPYSTHLRLRSPSRLRALFRGCLPEVIQPLES